MLYFEKVTFLFDRNSMICNRSILYFGIYTTFVSEIRAEILIYTNFMFIGVYELDNWMQY